PFEPSISPKHPELSRMVLKYKRFDTNILEPDPASARPEFIDYAIPYMRFVHACSIKILADLVPGTALKFFDLLQDGYSSPLLTYLHCNPIWSVEDIREMRVELPAALYACNMARDENI